MALNASCMGWKENTVFTFGSFALVQCASELQMLNQCMHKKKVSRASASGITSTNEAVPLKWRAMIHIIPARGNLLAAMTWKKEASCLDKQQTLSWKQKGWWWPPVFVNISCLLNYYGLCARARFMEVSNFWATVFFQLVNSLVYPTTTTTQFNLVVFSGTS